MPQVQFQALASADRQPVTLDELFDRAGVRSAYDRNCEIFGQDEPADCVYRVVSGAVRTTRLLSDGRRQIGSFYYEGDVFGLETGPNHRFSAEALGGCVIRAVRRSVLARGEDGQAVQRLLWQATAEELERTQEHMLLLGRKSACERVAAFIGGLAGRAKPGAVDLPMGRQDMADYLGLTIETVSRMLTQLQADRIIQLIGPRRLLVCSQASLSRIGEGGEALWAAA